MTLTVNDLREQYYKKKKEKEQAAPASSAKAVDDLRQAYYQRKETQKTEALRNAVENAERRLPKNDPLTVSAVQNSAKYSGKKKEEAVPTVELTHPRATTAAQRKTEKAPISDRAKKTAEIRKDIDTTPTQSRVGKGAQSVFLSPFASIEYLGEAAQQTAENRRKNAASAGVQDYAAAVSEFNRVRKLYPEGSAEYQTALRNLELAQQGDTRQYLDTVVDPNSRASRFMGYVNQLQEEALEGTSGAGRFLGEAALSIGSNLSKLPLNAILPGASLALMGAEAAAGKAYELGQQGVGAGEALTRGLVSGGIEALTEKVPLDNLMDIVKTGGKTGLWNIVKQAATEAGEEGVSYILNYGADKVAGDPEAEFIWNDFWRSMGMGAFSGGIMGGGATAINRANAAAVGKNYQDAAPELIAEGLELGQDTDAFRTATEMQRKVDAGKPLSNVDVGRMVQDNEAAVAPLKQAALEMAEQEIRAREQAQQAAVARIMGYGNEGAKTFSKELGTNRTDAETLVEQYDKAYQSGLIGARSEGMSGVQLSAYAAGKADRDAQRARDLNAKPAAVYSRQESGFDFTNAPSDITERQRNFGNLMAKTFGIKGNFVEGETDYNARYVSQAGEVNFAKDFGIDQQLMQKLGDMDFQQKVEQLANKRQQSFAFYVAHEIADHVAANRAPAEMRAFNNAMYGYLRETEGANLARERMAFYSAHGKQLDTKGAIEEVAADSILMLYDGDEQKFMTAMERVLNGTDEQAKQGAKTWGEALKSIIEKLKAWARKLTGRDNAKAKADVEKSVAELERLRGMFESAIAKAAQNTEQARKAGGTKNATLEGDVEHSVHKNFSVQLSNWDQKTVGFSFVLGDTSEALLKAGIPRKQIRMDATKIVSLLKKHNGMTIGTISQIPTLLENPVVVIDSKSIESARIVMGDLQDENGKTVTVVLLMTPTSKKGNQLDVIKVSSAEGRGHIKSLFFYENGDPVTVRYVDEKRIHSWLNVNRLQLPLHNLGLDPNNTVPQPEEIVKAGNEGATFEDDGVQHSIKSLRHDITEGRMFDDLVTAKVFNRKEADLLRQNLDKLVSYMTPNADILDMNEEYGKENRPYSSYKPNSDPLYVISLDFSTLCRKRLMTQYVIEQLQLKENRPMSAEEQIAIRSMLLEYRQQEKALQVACAMCYVEAARLKAPKQMERFFNDTEAIMRKYFAKKDKDFNDKVKAAQAKFKRDHGYDENAAKKDMSGKDTKALNEMSARMRKEYTPDAKQQAIIDKAKSLPRSTFLTAGNLTALAIDHPDIYAAYTDHIRASTRSKSLESDIPYYYGDSRGPVSDTFIDSVNAENGMRFDSWSDFQMKHMLDMITAVIDLSVRGSKMHGYTKFPEMVRIFGKTGMMFNLSGVTEGTGFDENGDLLFSNTEGIDIVEARKLLRDFPETAGLQCIGVSDDHVRALLRADYVDYVIPYHTSGMNATLRKMAGIHAWKDYTSTQHARKDPKAKKPENADKWQVEPVWSEFYVAEGEDGFDIMEKTAQRYIDLCHERGLIPKFDQFMDEPGYWKLLVDRKMVNQKTGEIIEQKPVKPVFDFDLIKQEIDREVSQYDPQLEKRALKYVVDNFDAVHQRIRDLKKGHPKKPMLKMANELLQAYAEGSTVQNSLKGEQQMAKELKRIREEGRKAGKSEQEIRADVAQVVEPEYAELLKTYGAIKTGETPARDVSVPEKTGKNRKVSQTVRTILEAEATPEEMIPDVQALVAEGALSFESYTDEQAIADATGKLVRDGWSDTLRSWQEDNAAGKISKEHTVTGWALYNYAANEGDVKTALDVLDGMVRSQRSAAQALQATRVLKQLAPEAQLYGVKRSVEKLQRDIDERSGDAKDVTELQREVDGARREAADKIRKAYSGAKVKGGKVAVEGNQAGEPFVFEYAGKVGEALAKSIAPKDSVKQQKTFLQQITSQLRRFASEKVQKTPGQKAMTATELLRDYIQNQSFYTEAWEAAQNSIRMQYADDERMSEFINSGIGVDATLNPKNAVFMQALVRAAAESKETRSMIVRQSSLGVTGMANNIAEQLIRETGAKGSMADTIRDAAAAYVNEVLRESDANQGDLVNASIKNAMHDVGTTLAKYITSTNSQKATIEQEIVSKLITKYSFGFTDATRVADVVRDHFNAMATAAARKNLANRFKKRTKTQKSLEQTMRELASLGAFDIDSAYNEAATEKVFKRGVKLKVNEELAQKFLAAETQEQRDAILEEIYADIGKQMPSTFRDKWNAWRYLAMLGNPRTHVRNVVGNAGFAPLVAAKNLTATAIESIVSKAVPIERTKSMVGGIALTNVFNKDRPLIIGGKTTQKLLKAAWEDYGNVADEISNGGKYSDFQNANKQIEAGRVIFKNKALEKARTFNSAAMEKEDTWFSKPHYAAALASYCKANGITAQQIAKGGKAMDKARAYAIKEAQKATYRDTNALSQAFGEIGGKWRTSSNPVKKGVGIAIEGILPFRKTPANILARGVEYSPIGLMNGIKKAVWDVQKGNATAAEAIDNISAGLTGTMLMALGAFLAAQGLIRGGGEGDDKEKEFAELQGRQTYAMELPNGKSVTLDWLAPEALPFFIGVNFFEATQGKKEEVDINSIIGSVTSITEPLLEMSCLQGLNDLIDSVGYASGRDVNALVAMAASAATSYLTQAIPTLGGQIERSFQKERMTTYSDKNKRWIPANLQYTIGKATAKIPVLDYQQIPYIDAWGRTESTGSFVENAFGNFLNPSYTSQIDTTAMEKELLRLYRSTGESVFPSRAAKYFMVNNERKDLTKEEYVQYATLKGRYSYELLTELVESDTYKALTDAEKAKMVKEVFDNANKQAKAAISEYELDDWAAKYAEAEKKYGIKQDVFAEVRMNTRFLDSLKDKNGETITNSLSLLKMEAVYNIPGLTDKQRKALFDYLGVGKSVRHYNKSLVKQKLTGMRRNAK